jgi:hypothetical protein
MAASNGFVLIGFGIYDPASPNILFKSKSTDRASCDSYYCEKIESCPLLKKKQCINLLFFGPKCPHGYKQREEGPTKRSRNCKTWIQSKIELTKNCQYAVNNRPPDKVVEVGDWIYLPYSHIDMNKNIPVLAHSGFMVSGSPFIKKEQFTVETVKSIVDFKPQAAFGGEIKEYQQKTVPTFLTHLKEVFPQLYDLLSKECVQKYLPNGIANYVGRKALLFTTAPWDNISIDKNYAFKWDGQKLHSVKYATLWLDIVDENNKRSIDDISVVITPNKNTIIKIEDNQQVTEQTIFID